MKNKTWFVPGIALALTIFVTLGCGATSQVVSTSAPASSPASAATPTEAAPPTAEPLPDVSSARILLKELPAGFEEFPADELGIDKAFSSDDKLQPQAVFAFVNKKQFQMIFGMNFFVSNGLDRLGFKFALNQPETLLKQVVDGMGKDVRDQKVLEGMEGVGKSQTAMTVLADMDDIPMRMDIAIFQRDIVGGMIMSMTLEGDPANISLHDLGELFDQHIQEALASSD